MTDRPIHPLGEAIAQGLTAHAETMRTEHEEHRKQERIDLLEHLEAEGIEAIREILGERLDCANLSPETAAFVKRLCKPEHAAELSAVGGVLIAVGYVLGAAVLAGPVSELSVASMKLTGEGVLDPNMLADAHRRNRVQGDPARDWMQESGIKMGKADALFDAAYQTLPPSQWMEYVRKFPQDEALFDEGLSHSGLDPQSIAAFQALRWGPPGVGDALNMATQNIIGMDVLQQLLQAAGISADWAQRLFDSSGATMPPEMAVRLFREGRMTVEQFEQVLLESNLKNKYVPFMKYLQFRPPPMEQTLRMFRHGIATEQEAVKLLEQNGFETYWAEKLVNSAKSQTTTGTKNLSPTEIIDLYQVGQWDAGTTQAQLENLGYSSDEAYCKIFLADAMTAWQRKNRAANRIGTRYTGWKIDRTVASSQLDQVGIPPAQRDDMLDEWDAVRETQTRHLTLADMKAAVKKAVMSVDQVRAELLASGAGPNVTDILIRTYFE